MDTTNKVETKLARIAQISKERPKEIFTSVYHLFNEQLLMLCHKELDGKKATGLDGITKEEYEEDLEQNIKNLAKEIQDMKFIPSPAKRVYIPKANGKMRGLAIANYEDKIVQLGMKKIIEAIYEPKFLNCMYGFRPHRGCHDALKTLNRNIENGKVNYVVDADIKGFFDHVDHVWLIRCIEQHIKDSRIIRKNIKDHIYMKVTEMIKQINIKLRGHYQYYGITDNGYSLNLFVRCVNKLLWKWLNRRSERKSYNTEEFNEMIKQNPLLRPKIYVNIYDV